MRAMLRAVVIALRNGKLSLLFGRSDLRTLGSSAWCIQTLQTVWCRPEHRPEVHLPIKDKSFHSDEQYGSALATLREHTVRKSVENANAHVTLRACEPYPGMFCSAIEVNIC
jgi:hypothetical protein